MRFKSLTYGQNTISYANITSMRIPIKKLKNGFELPIYGLGMGGKRESSIAQDVKDIKAIQATLDLGITHIDTAEKYADGHSEELLGNAIRGYDRGKLFIATKVASNNHTRDGIYRALEGSLKRIGTNYIDLYLLHRYPDPGLSIREAMQTLDELLDQGVIKNIGVCNFSPEYFQEAQSYTKYKLVCDQVHYNVQVRECEHRGVLDFCQQNDVMLVAWRPIERGALADAPLLIELAYKYNKSPIQVAINWLTSQHNIVTISRTSSITHLKENIGGLGWSMKIADIERIRKEFPSQQLVSYGEPLDNKATFI